jgi:hypothetical protein
MLEIYPKISINCRIKQDSYVNGYPKVSKTRNTVWVRLIWLESMSCLEMFKDLDYV